MNKRTLLFIVIGLIAVIVASSLIIYQNSVLTPQGSGVVWKRPIENFATGLAADTGKVFTMDISGNVNCYDIQNGKSIWNGSSVGGYFAAGLTVAEGRVYGGSEYASVGCLDETTGQFQWSFTGDIDHRQAPDNIIVKDGQVFTIAEGVSAIVSAHNATTGQLQWQTPYIFGTFGNITDLNTWWASGFPLGGDPFEGNSVYALGGNESSPYIFKLNTDNGNILWHTNITVFSGLPSVLATYQGQVIIQNGNQTFSLNETSGDRLWSVDVGASIYQPTAYNGLLLFGASDGNFYALNLADGKLAWKTKVDNQNLFSLVNEANTLTTYPIQVYPQNQRVYWSFGVTQQLGTTSENKHDRYTGTICSLDLTTGKVMWTRQIEDSGVFYSPPVGLVFNKDAVFLTENSALWVFSASTGNLARNQHFDHYVLPPVASDNEVFVAADLNLTAYG
jgi:outer membrane protein assembly factor BamB